VKFVYISISVLIVILIASVIEAISSLSNVVSLSYNFLSLSYSQQEQELNGNVSNQNKTTASAIDKIVRGTLLVSTNVNNEGGGSDSNPPDFTIEVHGNNPSISSFPGNSSGTVVKLDMGMYSVTASGPSNYNSSYSMDCAGAVMSVEPIKCEITNTYIKPMASNNSIQVGD
jgi:hypothetical protein